MKEDLSVDFLKRKYEVAAAKVREKKINRSFRWMIGLFFVLALGGMTTSYFVSARGTSTGELPNLSLLSTFRGLITSPDKNLPGETDDRINVLLMGIGGAGHDGPELTDTLIFASFRPSTGEIGMISIPRDMAIDIPDYGLQKINHANAYGELEKTGSGPEFASEVIGDVLDQEIHYYVKVDFDAFEELIDAIGGIDVTVDRSFTDSLYPTEDDLVQTISFEAGNQHMDGATALQFARSRHGGNGEGSDFARAERQQKILLAVEKKILSPAIFLNPNKLSRILDLFQKNVETNLTVWEIMRLSKYAADLDMQNIHLTVLDDSASGPLYSTMIEGSYVLLPKVEDWSEIQSMIENIFSGAQTAATAEPPTTAQNISIEIQNGTMLTGLAYDTSQRLATTGFDVVQIGNAATRDYPKTIIYDFSDGEHPEAITELQTYFDADIAMSPSAWVFSQDVIPQSLTAVTPEDINSQSSEQIDFLIVLGANAQSIGTP
ncbi:MAG: LCP family protein [Patescibacteria group bacterium]|jgi:LCP family protein required for cell wall assembly